MNRQEIITLCEREVLPQAARLFGTTQGALIPYADYEGCQNLVFDYERGGRPLILRISYRTERPLEQIQAELHFVNYLAEHGVRVARPVPSLRGREIEPIDAGGIAFVVVCFEKGRGMRVPDNGYRYREDAPIEEYFQNWGQVLGQMHALAKHYEPISAAVKRPQWHEMEDFCRVGERVPERLLLVRKKFEQLLARLHSLPRDADAYGLIHADFNDGNFTVDYDNGDITVFDFDDACYGWFAYELASAWEGGIGRTMFNGLSERRAFMEHYMEQVLEGYSRENTLDDAWLEHIPLFVQVIEMLEFLHFARYVDDPDPEMQAYLGYKIRCIEQDIPYMGFFDPIFSPEHPFSLPPGVS